MQLCGSQTASTDTSCSSICWLHRERCRDYLKITDCRRRPAPGQVKNAKSNLKSVKSAVCRLKIWVKKF
jgi:hypothetical protein